MRNRDIELKDEPCFYELGWDPTTPALMLRVHHDFIHEMSDILRRWRDVHFLREEFQFETFSEGFDQSAFGFDGAFLHQGVQDGFMVFSIPLPRSCEVTDKPCESCGGTGKVNSFRCFACEGLGREIIYKPDKPFYAISATLTVFTGIAEFFEGHTSCSFPQLLEIKTRTSREVYGGWVSGIYGKLVTAFLGSHYQDAQLYTELPFVSEAMVRSYAWMSGFDVSESSEFSAHVRGHDGWFNINCPGNACGLDPSEGMGSNVACGKGYQFSGHNTDSPIQQLTLLTALGVLHDKVRTSLAE